MRFYKKNFALEFNGEFAECWKRNLQVFSFLFVNASSDNEVIERTLSLAEQCSAFFGLFHYFVRKLKRFADLTSWIAEVTGQFIVLVYFIIPSPRSKRIYIFALLSFETEIRTIQMSSAQVRKWSKANWDDVYGIQWQSRSAVRTHMLAHYTAVQQLALICNAQFVVFNAKFKWHSHRSSWDCVPI